MIKRYMVTDAPRWYALEAREVVIKALAREVSSNAKGVPTRYSEFDLLGCMLRAKGYAVKVVEVASTRE